MAMESTHVSPRSKRTWDAVYSYLFGSATLQHVAFRMATDVLFANVAVVVAATVSMLYTGDLSEASTFGEAARSISDAYMSCAPVFTVLVVGLFCAGRMYCPLPAGRLAKRVAYLAAACMLGAVVQFGVVGLFRGNLFRSLVLPGWGVMFGFAMATRLSRTFFSMKFQLMPRTKATQSRVEHVLVVGGAGYIGSVLTSMLIDAGYQVRVLDLLLFGDESLQHLDHHPRLEVMEGDFRNVEDVVRALRGMDAVVHLAAIVGDPACAVDADTTIAVNYEAAKMIAQLSRANGISRFVFASTCSVYGSTDDIIDEQSELNPVSLYATTKIDAERALLETSDDVFQPTILRLATAYGWSYRPRFDLVANLFSAKAVTDKEITVFNGEQWRPFVNTRDIARAFLAVLEAPISKVGGEVFNVGDNVQNYTLSQLGKTVAIAMPGTTVHEKRNQDDLRNYRVRFDKIERTLSYRAVVSLEEGIREIVDAVRSGKVTDWKDAQYSNLKKMQDSVLPILKFRPKDENREHELQATMRFLRKAA